VKRAFVAVLAATVILGFHGSARSGPMLPPLRIASPADGATVCNPLTVVVDTPADLSTMTMTTHMTEHAPPHLHLDLDGRVTMPAMKHLRKVGGQRYAYVFGTVAAGRHTIRAYWADARTHKAMILPRTVTVTVR
jgi:hypothetical protein